MKIIGFLFCFTIMIPIKQWEYHYSHHKTHDENEIIQDTLTVANIIRIAFPSARQYEILCNSQNIMDTLKFDAFENYVYYLIELKSDKDTLYRVFSSANDAQKYVYKLDETNVISRNKRYFMRLKAANMMQTVYDADNYPHPLFMLWWGPYERLNNNYNTFYDYLKSVLKDKNYIVYISSSISGLFYIE